MYDFSASLLAVAVFLLYLPDISRCAVANSKKKLNISDSGRCYFTVGEPQHDERDAVVGSIRFGS